MEINKSTETIKEEKNLENGIKTLIIPKNLLQENCRLQYIIGNGFNDFFRIEKFAELTHSRKFASQCFRRKML